MAEFIQKYFSELVYLTMEMAPWLLLGLIFAGLLKVYFPQKHIEKYLGKPTARSSVNAALIGVPMPLCSCGVIPAAISLYKNGASKGATNSFLISTPQTGVDSILATYSMLGWPFALLRPFIAFVTGIAGGIVTNLLIKEKPKPSPLFSNLKIDNRILGKRSETDDDKNRGSRVLPQKERHSLIRAADYAFVELLQDISKWLVIGFLAAALISVLLPDSFFSMFKGLGLIEILIVLAASVPLYICATGSIPIAAVLLMKGVSPGAALVFLMAGPATNVATIAVLAKTMGRKSLAVYLGAIMGGAVLSGMLVNWLIPQEWLLGHVAHIHGQGHEMLPFWVQTGSSLFLVLMIVAGYFIVRIQKTKNMDAENSVSVIVEGMACSHCEATVTSNLSKIEGVTTVVADKNTNTVSLLGEKINLEKVEEVVHSLGYKYKGIKP